MKNLFVSPHLDDAIFSCVRRMLALRQAGDEIVICTVFAGDAPEWNMTERREEDREACARLGARFHHLPGVDALAREKLEASFESLGLTARVSDEVLAWTKHAVSQVIGSEAPDVVWWPLGVGGHVDHRAVFEASLGLFGSGNYYADLPYAGSDLLLRLRLREAFGGASEEITAEAVAAELGAAGITALFAEDELARCAVTLALRLGQSHAAALRTILAPNCHPAADGVVDAAEILAAYASQLAWLGPCETPAARCARFLAHDERAYVSQAILAETRDYCR
jgi:LmbE family N-acetylglucosaminyl deacetylase